MPNINVSKYLLRPTNPRGSNKPLPLKECCKNKKNLVIIWHREDLRSITCKECGHRFWRLWADPGSMGSSLRG